MGATRVAERLTSGLTLAKREQAIVARARGPNRSPDDSRPLLGREKTVRKHMLPFAAKKPIKQESEKAAA